LKREIKALWNENKAFTIQHAYYAYDIFWLSIRISFRFCFGATLITSVTSEKFVLVPSLLATCGRIRNLEQMSSGWYCHFREFFLSSFWLLFWWRRRNTRHKRTTLHKNIVFIVFIIPLSFCSSTPSKSHFFLEE